MRAFRTDPPTDFRSYPLKILLDADIGKVHTQLSESLTPSGCSRYSSSSWTGALGRHRSSRLAVAHSVSCHPMIRVATSTCVDRQCSPCFSSKCLARVDQTPLYSQYAEYGVISFN